MPDSGEFPKPSLTLDDFVQDAAWAPPVVPADLPIEGAIDGVRLQPLNDARYKAGRLFELLTRRPDAEGKTPVRDIPHVYRVYAPPGAARGWVYHKWQEDRLTFTEGQFLFVLYDLRPDSATFGQLNEIRLGADRPAFLTIPPLVVHGVKNTGDSEASFVNLPTRFYDPANPDKFRIPLDDPRMPYAFD